MSRLIRFFRYLAPNLVTATGLVFGLMSLVATHEQRYVDAGWLIVWAVMLDRVDGFVARSLKASSSFGVQMDSFADAINFGVAPAFLMYVSLSSTPALGLNHGPGRLLLAASCIVWVLANVFRLAKFNVVSEEEDAPNVFFGVPTTLAAGVLAIWALTLHKYAGVNGELGIPGSFRGPRIFGDLEFGLRAWRYMPFAMLIGGVLMASNLPQPKLRWSQHKWIVGVLVVGVASGFVCAFARYVPEYMALLPTGWLVASLIWGQASPSARRHRAPRFLPDATPAQDSLEDDLGLLSVVEADEVGLNPFERH